MSSYESIKELLINGDADQLVIEVEKALNGGDSPHEIIEEGLMAGMDVVGKRFKSAKIYVPEVLISARAMNLSMEVIKPWIEKDGQKFKGTVLLGTVKNDLHDIGKNLVAIMLTGGGFKVIDLGIDVPGEQFIESVDKFKPDIVGLSALITTTMEDMEDTVKLLKSEKPEVKIIIGGAPVTQGFANEIGADGYAPDAASAVDKVKELLNI